MKVQILCNECRNPFEKEVSYLKRRIKERKYRFYCSRGCADTAHSKAMTAENNPNYGGTFHGGKTMADLTSEERKQRGKKISSTMIERGTSAGANNSRWVGGHRNVSCIICGNNYNVRPYAFRKIAEGYRQPCCSQNCKRIYAQTQIKKARTSIEVKMAEELARREVEYIEQYNLGSKFALDFFLPEYGIVVECDGNYWHTLPDVAKRDKSKNAYIKACGYTLFRFWESEINECVEACVDVVLAEINAREVV